MEGGEWRVCAAMTALPYVHTRQLTRADRFFVVACDGLYDVMTADQVHRYVASRINRAHRDVDLDPVFDLGSRVSNTPNQDKSRHRNSAHVARFGLSRAELSGFATELAEDAIIRGSTDNVSVIVVFFGWA
jgi:serine/threonine protein phosphatase PrpC